MLPSPRGVMPVPLPVMSNIYETAHTAQCPACVAKYTTVLSDNLLPGWRAVQALTLGHTQSRLDQRLGR